MSGQRYDPAAEATEEHVRSTDIAKMYHVSLSTARRLMKRHPKCKYLPASKGRQTKKRTPILPVSALKDLYLNELVR